MTTTPSVLNSPALQGILTAARNHNLYRVCQAAGQPPNFRTGNGDSIDRRAVLAAIRFGLLGPFHPATRLPDGVQAQRIDLNEA
jgi:hypothetical protein